MDIWHDTLETILKQKKTFKKSYKCLNKNVPISKPTVRKHLEILVSVLNKIRILILTYYKHFNEENKCKAREIYLDQLDKFKYILQKHGINSNVSSDYNTKVVLNLENFYPRSDSEVDSEQPSDTDSEKSHKSQVKMPVTVAGFWAMPQNCCQNLMANPKTYRVFWMESHLLT